jgi:hypothetical protein
MSHLRSVRNDLGIDGIFRDSVLNALDGQFAWSHESRGKRRRKRSSSRQGYAPSFDGLPGDIRSLVGPRQDLLRDLQRLGYFCLLAGPTDLAVAGEHRDLGALGGREFMFRGCVVAFPAEEVESGRQEPLEVYFRGCAHGLEYALTFDVSDGAAGSLAPWWTADMSAVNTAYQAVTEHMTEMRILPEARGVLWTGADADVQVLWCLRKFVWAAGEDADVFEVVHSRPIDLQEDSFTAEPLSVYLVQDALPP